MSPDKVSTIQLLKDLWPMVTAFVVIILWAGKLQFEVLQNRKDLNAIGGKTRKADDTLWGFMSDIKETLARVEGKFNMIDLKITHVEKEVERKPK